MKGVGPLVVKILLTVGVGMLASALAGFNNYYFPDSCVPASTANFAFLTIAVAVIWAAHDFYRVVLKLN